MDFKATVFLLVAVIALALAACQQPAAPLTENAGIPTTASSTKPDKSDLAAVTEVFAGPEGRDWAAYKNLPRIKWVDPTPREEAPGRYVRNGRIMLIGLAEATISNGRPGLEYAIVKRNEGKSILTLIGTLSGVESISIQKPLYTDDYAGILKNQWGAVAAISLIADNCAANTPEEGAAATSFYAIKRGNDVAVYVRAAQEGGGKYSAGHTVFELSRTLPVGSVTAANCKALL